MVTKVDKPFVMESYPAQFDGSEYCQTPTVPCLKIPEHVIINNHHSPDITKKIFDGECRPKLSTNFLVLYDYHSEVSRKFINALYFPGISGVLTDTLTLLDVI